MPSARLLVVSLLPLALASAPAAAQFGSESYKFLTAVREDKGTEVIAALNKPGNTLVNTRDSSSGETALHIVVKRGDAAYVTFLLSKGADANARDNRGVTPLLLAVVSGNEGLIAPLVRAGANVNLANSSGETPLILAVHRRDVTMVRDLLTAGADPDETDNIAGKSARDYANGDPRNTAVARIIADTPKKQHRGVAGPR
jgi:ankyrin repeat protein